MYKGGYQGEEVCVGGWSLAGSGRCSVFYGKSSVPGGEGDRYTGRTRALII